MVLFSLQSNNISPGRCLLPTSQLTNHHSTTKSWVPSAVLPLHSPGWHLQQLSLWWMVRQRKGFTFFCWPIYIIRSL